MTLEALGIAPANFAEATHLAQFAIGECTLIVPCKSEEEAQHIKATVTEFFGSPVEDSAA